MRKIDAHGWPLNVGSGLVVIGVSTFVAVNVDREWSWPLFAWGALSGPLASAWAYYSTQAFGRTLIRRAPAEEGEALRVRQRALWPKYRATYAGLTLVGIGVGILAAGVRSPAIDLGFTALWIVFGLLPPLIAFPLILRRVNRLLTTPTDKA